MYRVDRTLLWIIPFLLVAVLAAWCKDSAKSEASSFKVCVASISNRTATSLLQERMAERLTKGLMQNKVGAITMDSATTDDRELRPSITNGNEMKRQECDYVLLTQVRDPKNNWPEPSSASVQIGGRVPSTDASDPMGGSRGPVYRENLEIHYAVFRGGKFESEFDGTTLERPSSSASDSLMGAMDRIAGRVAHDLKKKRK